MSDDGVVRVAYTMEQSWHRVPGGSAAAAVHLARALVERDDVELIGVAGRHRQPPAPTFRPPMPVATLPLGRPWLYEAWNRFSWPRVESATGPADVCHSLVAIPAATRMPHVVTVHDVAFVHTPERFTGRGVRVMRAGLERCRTVDLCCVPSDTTRVDLIELGFDDDRLRVVPWGVDLAPATAAEVDATRRSRSLPDEFVLFVGTVEPRKNLGRLAAAVAQLDDALPLVVAGAPGWGESAAIPDGLDVRFLGFVDDYELRALYATASVFAYPSLQEGFGMPVLEAMAQGCPVVTSVGTATEEAAGGAGVLIDPTDVDSIAGGIVAALSDRARLIDLGRQRAASQPWATTAEIMIAAYRDARG